MNNRLLFLIISIIMAIVYSCFLLLLHGVTDGRDAFYKIIGIILANIIFIIIGIIVINKCAANNVNILIVPFSLLPCLILLLIFNKVSGWNSGIISFGNYFAFFVMVFFNLLPVFLILMIISIVRIFFNKS